MRTSPSFLKPSRTSKGRAAVAALTAAAATALLASSAHAATSAPSPDGTLSTTLTYTCKFPVVAGTTTVTAEVTSTIPSEIRHAYPNPEFVVTANASIPGIGPAIKALNAATIEGAIDPQDPDDPNDSVRAGGRADATISVPGQPDIPVSVDLGIEPQPLSNVNTAVQHIVAEGVTPRLEFDNDGIGKITLQSLDLNVELRTPAGTPIIVEGTKLPDSDGDPESFDVLCTQDDPDHVLGTFTVTDDAAIPTPGPARTPTPIPARTPTPIPTLTPTPSPMATPRPDPTTTPTVTPTPLPTRTPTGTTVPIKTPVPTPLPIKTPVPTPLPTKTPPPVGTPAPVGTVVDYPYSIKGSAALKNLVKGALPLTGSINAHLNLTTFAYTAQLQLNETTGNLTALGFLPVQAKVDIVPTQDVTGTLIDSKLLAKALVRIKLPKISSFGLQLAGGATCQTTQISTINLASTQPAFDPFVGGPIAGSFSISNLAGCGVLNGIVSPLTAGSGNTILLNLTPTA